MRIRNVSVVAALLLAGCFENGVDDPAAGGAGGQAAGGAGGGGGSEVVLPGEVTCEDAQRSLASCWVDRERGCADSSAVYDACIGAAFERCFPQGGGNEDPCWLDENGNRVCDNGQNGEGGSGGNEDPPGCDADPNGGVFCPIEDPACDDPWAACEAEATTLQACWSACDPLIGDVEAACQAEITACQEAQDASAACWTDAAAACGDVYAAVDACWTDAVTVCGWNEDPDGNCNGFVCNDDPAEPSQECIDAQDRCAALGDEASACGAECADADRAAGEACAWAGGFQGDPNGQGEDPGDPDGGQDPGDPKDPSGGFGG